MSKAFWNKEYATSKHLTLSSEPSADLQNFERWAIRNAEWHPFPKGGMVLDIGCGNGRNIIHLCAEHDMKGFGFDISGTAVEQAALAASHKLSKDGKKVSDLTSFKSQSAGEPIPLPDKSVDVVLDMMVSHCLRAKDRLNLVKEIVRVLKPYGWLYFKTFILEADFHAKRLIAEHPDPGIDYVDKETGATAHEPGEANSYIHPRIGEFEHVYTESEIFETFREYFKIYKTIKSYKHFRDGKPYKRRTVSVYMELKREE
jgi:SAM-dependent methyltransferase